MVLLRPVGCLLKTGGHGSGVTSSWTEYPNIEGVPNTISKRDWPVIVLGRRYSHGLQLTGIYRMLLQRCAIGRIYVCETERGGEKENGEHWDPTHEINILNHLVSPPRTHSFNFPPVLHCVVFIPEWCIVMVNEPHSNPVISKLNSQTNCDTRFSCPHKLQLSLPSSHSHSRRCLMRAHSSATAVHQL